ELSFSNVRDAGGLDSALHDPVGDTDTEAPQEVFELRQGAADVRILHLGELDGHENRAEFSRGRVAKRRHVDLRNQKRWRSRIAWLDRLGWRGRVVLAVRAPASLRTKTQKALGTPRPPLAVGGVSSQRKRTEYMTAESSQARPSRQGRPARPFEKGEQAAKRIAETLHPHPTELFGELRLHRSQDVEADEDLLLSALGEAHELGATIRWIGDAFQQALRLERIHELPHRLLGRAHAPRELREPNSFEVDVGEELSMSRPQRGIFRAQPLQRLLVPQARGAKEKLSHARFLRLPQDRLEIAGRFRHGTIVCGRHLFVRSLDHLVRIPYRVLRFCGRSEMPSIVEWGEGIWTIDKPHRTMGIELGTRTTIVRLPTGGIVLLSPGPLSRDDFRAIDELGRVEGLVAPNVFHHLYLRRAHERFPEAAVFLAPGLREKVPDLPPGEALSDEAPKLWAGSLEQLLVKGTSTREVVFFHPPSRTLVLTD